MSNDPNPPTKPKAYLNWMLLDDQLKYVSSSPQSYAMAATVSGLLTTLANTGIPITKNGFLYIWVSNETVGWNVFFRLPEKSYLTLWNCVSTPCKLDSFQLVDKNGSTIQSSCNEKAATKAAFGECEPDWSNIEPFCRRIADVNCFCGLKKLTEMSAQLGLSF